MKNILVTALVLCSFVLMTPQVSEARSRSKAHRTPASKVHKKKSKSRKTSHRRGKRKHTSAAVILPTQAIS
jgi:hypothetical protein